MLETGIEGVSMIQNLLIETVTNTLAFRRGRRTRRTLWNLFLPLVALRSNVMSGFHVSFIGARTQGRTFMLMHTQSSSVTPLKLRFLLSEFDPFAPVTFGKSRRVMITCCIHLCVGGANRNRWTDLPIMPSQELCHYNVV